MNIKKGHAHLSNYSSRPFSLKIWCIIKKTIILAENKAVPELDYQFLLLR